jgi:hypothetical protein
MRLVKVPIDGTLLEFSKGMKMITFFSACNAFSRKTRPALSGVFEHVPEDDHVVGAEAVNMSCTRVADEDWS